MLPPGPRYPVALQTLGWIARPGPFMERCRDRYGDAFTLRLHNEDTWVLLSDPAAVKQVFTGDPKLLHSGEANGILRPIVGPNSVLLLDDRAHMSQRKLLLPPFHGERMKAYGGLMAEAAEAEIAAWPAGQVVATRPAMQRITLEIVMRAIFGITDTRAMGRMRAALTSMLDWTTRPSRLMLLVAAGPKGIPRIPEYRAVMAELDAVIAEAIAGGRAASDVAERGDVLSMLLGARHEDDGSPMTDAELRDELVTLLVAGHETTATALSWALERLARHPEAWARLRSGDEPYLDAVIKETLRLRPVLPIVLRRLKAPLEIGGWELPEGVSAVPCIYLMHRRPDIYPDPLAFRPERFLEQPAGTYTWIPFGGGVRRCLGASFAQFEMAAVLRVLARRCASLEPDGVVPERTARRSITLVPARDGAVVVG
ncbi:MAG TPA: cytochrome P450 [Solirubrobacteraceae bacterium]|nr:cytochrome P450 [Solirubrobacteraceae bacterium]